MEPSPLTPLAVVGVVADTHVPDRIRALPGSLLRTLEQANVRLILHAGDISSPAVLDELSKIAPVTAVRGNRDFMMQGLPLETTVQVEGVTIGLAHGHGGFLKYWLDKGAYLREGYAFERYRAYLAKAFTRADVMVFGHTHRVENRCIEGRLYFNPGSVYICRENGYATRLGLLKIYTGGLVEAESIACE